MAKTARTAPPKETDRKRVVFAVSDSTAMCAEALARAAGEQFGSHNVAVRIWPNVLSRDDIERVIREAESEHALVIYTFASLAQLRTMQELAASSRVPAVHDPFTPLVNEMGRWLGESPMHRSGHLPRPERSLAFEFAVANDDGKRPDTMKAAHVLILGVSRTSKTSVSYQLAERGYLAANCPIVPEIPLPRQTDAVDPRRVFVLVMQADELCKVRQARLPYLGRGQEIYADIEQVESELRTSLALLRGHPGWTRIDVTSQPPEETAAKILQIFAERFPTEVR